MLYMGTARVARKMSEPKKLLPPANEVCEGYVITGVCLSTGGGGCMAGGHAWQEDVGGRQGHAWQGGMHGGGMHGREACMSKRGCTWQGACISCTPATATPPRQILRDTVIQSMSGRYASYWNAFLFSVFLPPVDRLMV